MFKGSLIARFSLFVPGLMVVLVMSGCSSGSTGGSAPPSTPAPAPGVTSVNHVIFMLQENHTFDNYFGMLNPYRAAQGWTTGDDGTSYQVDGIDDKLASISNQNDEGDSYSLFKLKSTCIDDASSGWLESFGDVNRYDFTSARTMAMDGFVHNAEGYARSCLTSGTCQGQSFSDTAGQRVMGYYDQDYLNYYYYMASEFAVSDRWFSPVASKSTPNRLATFTGGTTQGLVLDPGSNDKLGKLDIPSIFQELDATNVTWKVYYSITAGACSDPDDCSTSASAKFPATTLGYLNYAARYLYENPTITVKH